MLIEFSENYYVTEFGGGGKDWVVYLHFRHTYGKNQSAKILFPLYIFKGYDKSQNLIVSGW